MTVAKLTEEQKGLITIAAQQTLDRMMKKNFDNKLAATMDRTAPDIERTEKEVREFLWKMVPTLKINYN